MQANNKISSEEIKTSKIGEEIEIIEEKTAIETPRDRKKKKTSEIATGEAPTRSMTPVEIAQKKCYEKEAAKNEAKVALFVGIRYCVWTITGIIGILATLGAVYLGYYLNNISEPMGSLKKSVEHIEKNNNELRIKIKEIEDKLSEIREEVRKQKFYSYP